MNIDLTPGFSKIRGQGGLGSCTAFAATGILEYMRNRIRGEYGRVSADNHYSARYVYFNNRPLEEYAVGSITEFCPLHGEFCRDLNKGSFSNLVKRSIEKFGACDDREWDYKGCAPEPRFPNEPRHVKNKFALKPTPECYAHGQGVFDYIENTVDMIPSDPELWKAELKKGLPVYISIDVTRELDDADGVAFFDTVSNDFVGSHAIIVMGYSEMRVDKSIHPSGILEKFKLRNSWGPRWGDRGYIWITRRALEPMINKGERHKSLVFRPKKPFVPFEGPKPAPTPSTPPKPNPAPPAPTPPTPTPPPGPAPAPSARSGDFRYQWWLFNDEAEFTHTSDNHISPSTLHSHGRGRKLDGPDHGFGKPCGAKNMPNKGSPDFLDLDALIADAANAGKVIGLGACRLAEIPAGTAPESADGRWKWDSFKIKTPGKVEAKVFVAKDANAHPPNFGGNLRELNAGKEVTPEKSARGTVPDFNFFIDKTGAGDIQMSMNIYKKRADDETTRPDPARDQLIPPDRWNLRIRFGGDRKIIALAGNRLDLPKKTRVDILPYLHCPGVPDVQPGQLYYILVQAFHDNALLDQNLIEFRIIPPA